LRDEQAARLDRFATALRKTRDAAGRQPFVTGSGLAVWEVLMVAEGHGMDVGATAQHLRLDREKVA
jgi:hypothetical protein